MYNDSMRKPKHDYEKALPVISQLESQWWTLKKISQHLQFQYHAMRMWLNRNTRKTVIYEVNDAKEHRKKRKVKRELLP